MDKIRDFTDLIVWKKAHKLSVDIYKLTENFPKSEQYSLTSQIRRASSSVSANIAEGFGRLTPKDKEHFYIMASGSLYELRNHLYLAQDIDYIDKNLHAEFNEKCIIVHQLLNGLLRAHRSSKINNQDSNK